MKAAGNWPSRSPVGSATVGVATFLAWSDAQKTEVIKLFDARFGEMEQALWYLSQNSRPALLAQESSSTVEALVWAVKSWWGVQGVRSETKPQIAAALARVADWAPGLFEPTPGIDPDAAEYAFGCVSELVGQSMAMGVPRREYSLASKVLHWLLPWRVPAYDENVRRSLGVPSSWDHPKAYRQVAKDLFQIAAGVQNAGWLGQLEPASPLRALDKCLWWLGGGNVGTAAVVRDPWHVVRQLGRDAH